MDGVIIIALISLQLVSFFFIVILFAKLNKFKDLEQKQEKIAEEMDSALAAYLMEMKEENDRLIKQLSAIPKQEKEAKSKAKAEAGFQEKGQTPGQSVPKLVSPTTATSVYKTNIEKQKQIEETELLTPNSNIVELKGRGSQQKEKLGQPFVQQGEIQVELTYEEKVVEMYRAGKSVEEIAKAMDKGKTEIELLIKFHT